MMSYKTASMQCDFRLHIMSMVQKTVNIFLRLVYINRFLSLLVQIVTNLLRPGVYKSGHPILGYITTVVNCS